MKEHPPKRAVAWPPTVASSSSSTVVCRWLATTPCDCARCRIIRASREAIHRFGSALDRLGA